MDVLNFFFPGLMGDRQGINPSPPTGYSDAYPMHNFLICYQHLHLYKYKNITFMVWIYDK